MAEKMIGIVEPKKGIDPALEARQLEELNKVTNLAWALLAECEGWQATAGKIADLGLTPGESRAPFFAPWVNGLRSAVREALDNAKRYGI